MTNKKPRILLRVLICLLSLLIVFSAIACVENKPATTISFDITRLELTVGKSQKIKATVSGISDPVIAWESADKSVATVNKNGVVTGVNVGETSVTAKINDAVATCTVVVKSDVNPDPAPDKDKRTAFSIGIGAKVIYLGDTLNIRPTLIIEDEEQDGISVQFSLTDGTVATIDNGVLNTLKVGETTITATCVSAGKTYSDSATVQVAEYSGDSFDFIGKNGKGLGETIVFTNEKLVSESISVRYYSRSGIDDYPIEYVSTESGAAKFNVKDNDGLTVGELKFSLLSNNNNIINSQGKVNATLDDDTTKNVNMTLTKLRIGAKDFDVSHNTYRAFVKADNVYTDFVEFGDNTNIGNYFTYNYLNSVGMLSIDKDVTYQGTPSLKIEIPVDYSYFHFSDIIANYKEYGLTVGSKISFKIRYDGYPTKDVHYYAINKLISKNGKSQDGAFIIGYTEAQEYISQRRTDWQDVTFVLDDASFPLVDLGIKIAGNSLSTKRYVYISYITIDNPDSLDYTDNFGNAVEWDNRGRNLPESWWGYSLGVANAFESKTVPQAIAQSYQSAYGSELPSYIPVATPTLKVITTNIVLQNSSCSFSNNMKGTIYKGNNKIKVRVYLEATGTLPTNNSVKSLVFLRKGDDAGYGLSQDKLQSITPNTWTELVFDVPTEYMQADNLTVAFNLDYYYQCNENVSLKFYLGKIAFVNT